MKKIINPFEVNKNQACFGCSSANEIGLQMQFFEDGDEIISDWIPKKHFEGYQNILHGGIQATLHDEIASWLVYVKCETSGVTASLNIRYKKPVLISEKPIQLRAKLIQVNRKIANIETKLFNSEGILCSQASIDYFIYNQEFAKEKLNYPGIDKFYNEA